MENKQEANYSEINNEPNNEDNKKSENNRSSKKSNMAKFAMLTFLTGAITYNHFKKVFFGSNPDSKRRSLFYIAIGTIFVYNAYGEKIGSALSQGYTKIEQLMKKRNKEKIEELEIQTKQRESTINHLKRSLENSINIENELRNKLLEERLQTEQQKAKQDSLLEKISYELENLNIKKISNMKIKYLKEQKTQDLDLNKITYKYTCQEKECLKNNHEDQKYLPTKFKYKVFSFDLQSAKAVKSSPEKETVSKFNYYSGAIAVKSEPYINTNRLFDHYAEKPLPSGTSKNTKPSFEDIIKSYHVLKYTNWKNIKTTSINSNWQAEPT